MTQNSDLSKFSARKLRIKLALVVVLALMGMGPIQILIAYLLRGADGVSRALSGYAAAVSIAVPVLAAFYLAGWLERMFLRKFPRMSRVIAATLILLPMVIVGAVIGVYLALWILG